MKHLLWFIILYCSLPVYAQTVFSLDSLPIQGTVLDQHWQWQPGDNPAWATPSYDDRHWLAINPTQDITTLPQIQKTHIGWLRLHLRVDSTLLGKLVSMLVNQQVASQMYLNGRLIGGFGRVSTRPDSVEAYNPSGADQALWQTTHLQLGSSVHQVLAIRVACQPNLRYLKFWGRSNPLLLVKLHQADQRNVQRVDSIGNFDATFLDYFKSGLFIILAILHLVFYVWYPLQRVNLWFGLYCLLSACTYLIQPLVYQYVHSVSARTWLLTIDWAIILGAQPIFLLAVYNLSDKRTGFFFYCILTAVTVAISMYVVGVDLPAGVSFLLLMLPYIESCRQLFLIGRKRSSGYRILITGAVLYIVFEAVYLAIAFLWIDLTTTLTLQHLFYNLGALSLPMSITLFLASRFAQTYRLLGEKLVQVEALSAQNLAQEQEKQHLLASQNEVLERQVNARTLELSQSLAQLRSTQNQLIQKEKMASLGELTAGIAHEIQNPLNFVNNFAEVSTEVIDELTEGPIQLIPDTRQAEAQELLEELTQNLRKITHHGRRAASIVRGMLEHSRSSTGERRATDLNALIQEYLGIAYQGFRATHPQFTCQLLTEFDQELEPVLAMPQELSRVLLNLFNNAFYAVEQRRKTDGTDYQPTVRVQSCQLANGVQLRIEDNGTGIAEAIKAKIFQPFFTTKPTGQGTGLGLSLSYDIITKGHGGELYVDSQPGDATTFTIIIPTSIPAPSLISLSRPEPAL